MSGTNFDTRIVKAHQHVSGAAESNNEAEVIGISVAGNTTKINILARSNGNPVRFEVSGGRVHKT